MSFEVFGIIGACLAAIGYTLLAVQHGRALLKYRRKCRQWGKRIRSLEHQLALIDQVHQDDLQAMRERQREQLEEREADHLAAVQKLDDQLGEMTGLHVTAQTRVRELELELERKVQELEAAHDQLAEVRADWTVGVRRVLTRSQVQANG